MKLWVPAHHGAVTAGGVPGNVRGLAPDREYSVELVLFPCRADMKDFLTQGGVVLEKISMVVDRPSRLIFAGSSLHQFRGMVGSGMVRHEFRLLLDDPIPGFDC